MAKKKQTNTTTSPQNRSLGPEPDVTTKPKVANVKVKAKETGGGDNKLNNIAYFIELTCNKIDSPGTNIASPVAIKKADGSTLVSSNEQPTFTTNAAQTVLEYPPVYPPVSPALTFKQMTTATVAFDGDSTGNINLPFSFLEI